MDPAPAMQSTKKKKTPTTPAPPTATNSRAAGSGSVPASKTQKTTKKKVATGPAGAIAEQPGQAAGDQPAQPLVGLAKPKKLATKKVDALKVEEKEKLADDWGMGQMDPRFVLAMEADKYFNFVSGLKDDQWTLVRLEDIERAQPLKKESWAQLREEQRLGKFPFDDADKRHWLARWKLSAKDERSSEIFKSQKNFDFFREIELDEYRKVITPDQIRHRTPYSERQIIKAIEAKQQKSQAKENERNAQQDAKERRTRDAQFAQFCTTLKGDLTKRMSDVDVDLSKWEAAFDRDVNARTAVIATNQQATVENQQVALGSIWWEEVRQHEVKKEATKHPLLKSETLEELKTRVLGNSDLQAFNLADLCRDALTQQRNPDAVTWVTLLGLQLYVQGNSQTMLALPSQIGHEVHFRVDQIGLSARLTQFTANTTGLEVLNALFRAPSGRKTDNVHVTIETFVDTRVGNVVTRHNPHMYWGFPVEPADIYYWTNLQRLPKWRTAHTEEEVTVGLQRSMQEAIAILEVRATNLIANACNPNAGTGTRRG